MERDGVASTAAYARSEVAQPALYALPRPGATGKLYVTAVDPFTGELVGNPAADPRVSRGARPGETIDLYGIGLGAVMGGTITDRLFWGSYPLYLTATVLFGEGGQLRLKPDYAGLVSLGLYMVRVKVPETLEGGDVAIGLDIGGHTTSDNLFLTIEP